MQTQGDFERPTQYYMPQVDSFSLRGMKSSPTSQIGIKAEFVHFRNTNWSTVVILGTGILNESRRFSAQAAYSPNGLPIEPTAASSPLSRYLIQNIGLAYQHDLKRKKLKHTLTVCAVQPIEKYSTSFGLKTGGNQSQPIFEGRINEDYFHHKSAFGLEYNPELLLHTHKRVYFGLGMVFNYSWGVLAQGRATVTNGRTTYYGGMLQRFSKIGITASMGFQGRRSVLDN